MKVTGIIAEYNPFHNGHQYHIEKTRQETGTDYIVALMSGDFVQRGAPAIIDKYDRARCALEGGCDLVIELPAVYSTGSAEFFASGAVTLLDRLGVADTLSFGTESGSLEGFDEIAELLLSESEEFQALIKTLQKTGISYPAARMEALRSCLEQSEPSPSLFSVLDGLDQANNILALEYIKSLKKLHSPIRPFTVKREKAAYHDTGIYENMASATAVRNLLLSGTEDLSPLLSCLSREMITCLKREAPAFLDVSHMTPYLHSRLHCCRDLPSYLDWDEDLSNRMKGLSWQTLTYEEIVDSLKSRQVTRTRIQRALIHLLLKIKSEDFYQHYKEDPVPYARILGFRKESSPLLKKIKEHSSIPVITKPASIKKVLSSDALWMWEKDLAASDLYRSLAFTSYGKKIPSAFERTPVIL